MKIAYFVNSFNSINWGGQATSNGIKHLIQKNYPNAEFVPLNLPHLPYRKIKLLRLIIEKKLYKALMSENENEILKYLKKFNINENFYDTYTHICFNGEGAIHSKSGHIILLMALLYLAKIKGLYVASVNQTIDLNDSENLRNLVQKVYSKLNFLSVRESASYKFVNDKMNLPEVKLIPDAAYAIPKLSSIEIDEIVLKFGLPKNFIGIAGSSILKKNKESLKKVSNLIKFIMNKFPNKEIVFLANAKTDIWIAHKLKDEFNYLIIEPPVKYLDAMAIISKADLIIGGRQHINIFAYEYHVKYLPFGANTIKNIGVAQLQKYPINPLSWSCNYEEFSLSIDELLCRDIKFDNVMITEFSIFSNFKE